MRSGWIGAERQLIGTLTLTARAEGLLLAADRRFGIDGASRCVLRFALAYSADETDRAVTAFSAAWVSLARGPLLDHSSCADVISAPLLYTRKSMRTLSKP